MLSLDGATLVTGGTDGAIKFVNTVDWGIVNQLDAGAPVFALALSRTGKRLAVGLQTGQVRIFDIDQDQWQSTLQMHAGPVQSVLFTRSEKTIVSGGNDKAIMISDLEIGERKMKIVSHLKQVRHLALSPDDTVLVSSDTGGETRVWRAPRPATSLERFDRD
jgi:WD40 repeat protein